MKTLKTTLFLLFALVFLNSCSDDDNEPALPLGDYEHGYFVTNEGPFQNGSGTITFIGDDGFVNQNIYKTVNGEDLGNIVTTMAIQGENAYIVVNNSNKIVVANRYTMEKITTIEDASINQPRDIIIKDNTAYVSTWGDPSNSNDDFIVLIDLSTNTVKGTIPVGEGPEGLLIRNNDLFVNLQGGWSQNNIVEIINLQSNTVVKSLKVGDVPNSLIKDNSGNVWVLCEGKPNWTGDETSGKLFKIDLNNEIESTLEFSLSDHPNFLNHESESLFYSLNGKVFEMNLISSELPTEGLNGLDGFYYSMKVDHGILYTTDAGDFTSEGNLKVFDLQTLSLIETITTGIIPGDVVFQ